MSQNALCEQALQTLQNQNHQTDYLNILSQLYQQFSEALLQNPQTWLTLQMNYWQEYLLLCQHSLEYWASGMNHDNEVHYTISIFDKRFKNESWEQHPFFKFLKDFYLMTTKHIQAVVLNIDSLDEKTLQKIGFFTQQYIDAISPSNFIFSNPEVLQKAITTQGQSLYQGMLNFMDDLSQSKSFLKIKMTDLDAFEIGKNLATTPGKVIYQNEMMQLIQYEPCTPQVYEKPLLIIPPWINKYYILDLSKDNSFVKWIVEQGFTVFMISWVNPTSEYKDKNFFDYVQSGVLTALEQVKTLTKCDTVNTLGFCIGGTLLAATNAYLTKKNIKTIQSTTYLATLIDFSDPGDISAFIDEAQINYLENLMQEDGVLHGSQLALAFNMLRANGLIWSYFVRNYLLGEKAIAFDMLYWNHDSTNLPYKMHSEYLRNMYLHNRLIEKNAMQLDGTPLDISLIQTPSYFLSTYDDHITPWKTIYNGALAHSGPVEFVLGGSGHIAGVINPPQKNKYDYYTHTKLDHDAETWFKQATKHTGSWWTHWCDWLKDHSGEQISPRKIQKNKIIEDAPGSYVKASIA